MMATPLSPNYPLNCCLLNFNPLSATLVLNIVFQLGGNNEALVRFLILSSL
ncbi:hypothetical protein SLEP1_g18879 [Rubroshorea leprosula]|uniref:Uncharacterized protein n=1 Tax=Rubroshorea leprosula TaxID=152421 RepID=A0AAV5IYY6_9ROSI|nr:hypothetical protein SLEP1_g18879 [Rubroshorea leprosula]